MGCSLGENGLCVVIKLTYKLPSKCLVSVSSFNHGLHFIPDLSKLRLSEKSKNEIKALSKVISPLRLKPTQIFSTICVNAEKNNIPATNSALIPSLRQLNDLLYYQRKRERTGNFYEDLDEFIKKGEKGQRWKET